jgi:hypothetical protein
MGPIGLRTIGAAALACALAGCEAVLGQALSCEGHGSAHGRYEQINTGSLEFRHVVAIPQGSGYAVIFTDDPTLAAVMRASADPEGAGTLAARMYGRLLIGYRFDARRRLTGYFSHGSSEGGGSGGGLSGRLRIDGEGCIRGHVRSKYDGAASFAVRPVVRDDDGLLPSAALAKEGGALEVWSAAYERLVDSDPVVALMALGFSRPVAVVLARDVRSSAVLERMRTQCADPAQARIDEWGDVVGPSPAHEGFVFKATVRAGMTGDGAVIDNCSVMSRNGESVEQCWPLHEDCRVAPVWVGG